MKVFEASILAFLAATVKAGTTAEWKQRSIYQVLTDRFARADGVSSACTNLSVYCGGNYQGMINQLDYIQGMGFDAIWISPIVENYPNSYHGYHATNWETVNTNFGSKQDLINFVTAAHARGIWVMVDVVANHVGPVGSDYSQITPLNQSSYYHTDCDIVNWSDQAQVEYCRLADLPDLDQDNSYVRSYLKSWVQNIVTEYGFDGIRIDTIPEVSKDFWAEYGASAGVFQMGECFNGDASYVGPYQNYVTALFNYPMYYTIKNVFGSHQSMYQIRTQYSNEANYFKDIDALGVFVDNHDNPRFLYNFPSNNVGLKQAVVFALTSRGIPFTYYGTEQYYNGGPDPACRESLWQDYNTNSDLYKIIKSVNAQRKASQIWNSSYVERYVDNSFFAFSRGEFLVALTNNGSTQQRQVTYSPFANGTVVCNIFYPTTDCQTTNNGLYVYLLNGESKIYVPKSKLAPELFSMEEIDLVQKILQ